MSEVRLTNGGPVPADGGYRDIDPATGMQKAYVVLSDAERAKGFVKPVRRSYLHHKCGSVTTMDYALAETYARDPRFYSGTFCSTCRAHYGLYQFSWEPDGEPMEVSQQDEWHKQRTQRISSENEDRRQRRITELRRELAELEAQVRQKGSAE